MLSRNNSINKVPYVKIIPPMNPIIIASHGLQIAHIDVIDTRPASIPPVNVPTSNFPSNFFVQT